jgi:DMSO/TMAO reductase YedYZ molybdopterin-dependent catalytic subunit
VHRDEQARSGPDAAGTPGTAVDTPSAAWLGLALGVTFAVCFATGLWSHVLQHPPSWLTPPPRPAGLYRMTQGVHVASGTAAIPLLLAKLWVVRPHLTAWPPVRSALHAVERLALLPLVGGGVFLLLSGTANVARWYPWEFYFPAAHYTAAWITVGALIIHVGAKATATSAVVRGGPAARRHAPPERDPADRRAFLAGVTAASGVLVLATAGGTVPAISPLSVLAQRRPGHGPQGLPVNKTAAAAGVVEAADDPAYRLVIAGRDADRMMLSLADLHALPQHEATLPIACVEGWSASARWRGVRIRDLLAAVAVGVADVDLLVVESLQTSGRFRSSELRGGHVRDPDTLLAVELDGEPLDLDHGYPARLIAPGLPGVMQTKWVTKLVLP